MPASLPNPLSLPAEARSRIWAQLQVELEQRVTGKVVSGSGLGQSFTMQHLTWAEFMALYNSFSDVMGGVASTSGISQTRPNFSGHCR
jgi:hypothetical protein